MRTPERLEPLLYAHLIEDVVAQLQSGKEAEVYVVLSHGEYRCAKVYKDSNNRSFKHQTQYTEGRKVRDGRRSRAMESKSKFGRKERENEWQNTEVEALRVLAAAGVSVPQTFEFYEGVLLLEMVCDARGQPAPRLSDTKFTAEVAKEYHSFLMREVVRMLCAGYIHGDLSGFNVLVSARGLVIIDLPQAVQATSNNAFRILERDLIQLRTFLGKKAPELLKTDYANEIWKLYQNGKLRPDSVITGSFQHSKKQADVAGLLREIDEVRDEAMLKRGIRK